jgi:putative peptidoglycan lipid II flippase
VSAPRPVIRPDYTQPSRYPEAPPRRGAPGGGPPPEDGDNLARTLELPAVPGTFDTGAVPRVGPQPNLARSSAVMALGSLVSRGTGFLRTFVLLYAIGTGGLADAYNNSNALPQTVYYLFLGGIFTSVLVPLMVKAAKNDPDRGEAYAERIFTLGVVALLTVTVVGTILAGPLVDLYAGRLGSSPTAVAEHQQMVLLAHFAMPQIFFFGMDGLLGAILNTRGRFGPNMWTPVINNVVVITVVIIYVATVGLHKTPLTVSPFGVRLLGTGALLGILLQSIALFPVLRKAGFSMHLRWDHRRSEVREIRRMASWMLVYVSSQWAANLVVQRVANSAAAHGATGSGYSIYFNSWQLFQLPWAVVGLSVISALLPRISGHATERKYWLVREDFSTGVRLAAVIVVPATVFLAALGAPLCEFLFAHGSTSAENARYIGEVFAVFALGLMPFMLTQLQLRVFYAFQENRAPAIIGVFMFIVGVAGDLIALKMLPPRQVVIGLAAAYGLVTLTGAAVAWPLQLRRVGSLDGWRITRSLGRMFLATLPGLVFAFVTMAVVGSVLRAPGVLYGLVSTVIGGGGALLLYAICAKLLRIDEFGLVVRSVAGRLVRRRDKIA